MSKDLHAELEWGRGVEKALAAQQGLISTEEYLSQQKDEHKVSLLHNQCYQSLAKVIISEILAFHRPDELRESAALASNDSLFEVALPCLLEDWGLNMERKSIMELCISSGEIYS